MAYMSSFKVEEDNVMQIVDLESSNERMVNEAAAILFEAFPHSWTDMDEALEEVHECLESGRITRVAIDNNGFALGWIGGKSMYGGNVWEMHPLVVSAKSRGLGIGSALVKDFEEQVEQRGAMTVWLGSDDEHGSTSISGVDVYPDVFKHIAGIRNLKSHPYEFYQKLGYNIVGICPDANGFGKPDIYMAKRVGKVPR
jgi:aminoglycoside 6'-N-acetyltransferase I